MSVTPALRVCLTDDVGHHAAVCISRLIGDGCPAMVASEVGFVASVPTARAARAPCTSPSSRGLGRGPFKAETRVRIPLGTPAFALHFRRRLIPPKRPTGAQADIPLACRELRPGKPCQRRARFRDGCPRSCDHDSVRSCTIGHPDSVQPMSKARSSVVRTLHLDRTMVGDRQIVYILRSVTCPARYRANLDAGQRLQRAFRSKVE